MANGALGDGVVVDLSRLDWIDPVDRESRTARCGPGALRNSVDRAAREHGLRFPVDPSSGAFCTIGGMVATNAAGAHSLAFGATRAWVHSIECVMANGSVATFARGERSDGGLSDRLTSALDDLRSHPRRAEHRVRKESSGYGVASWLRTGDVVDLIVGSEGTLALITAVVLTLEEIAHATSSLLATFDDLDAAVAGADVAREHGVVVCELLDRTFLTVLELGGALPPVPHQTEALLLVEVEARDAGAATEQARTVAGALGAIGATQTTLAFLPAEERELWEIRHAASPMLSRLDPSLCSIQVIEDGAVPPSRLGDYVRGIRRSLEAHGVRGVIFGHAGDAHVHVNPLIDVGQSDWRRRVEALLDDVTSLVAELGGTVAGEHGDGRLRAPILPRVWSAAALAAFRVVKDAFDPDGVLNPGVKLALAGQRPVEDVKYDPALPPLPAAARRALDRVAVERAYAVPRLSLLEGAV